MLNNSLSHEFKATCSSQETLDCYEQEGVPSSVTSACCCCWWCCCCCCIGACSPWVLNAYKERKGKHYYVICCNMMHLKRISIIVTALHKQHFSLCDIIMPLYCAYPLMSKFSRTKPSHPTSTSLTQLHTISPWLSLSEHSTCRWLALIPVQSGFKSTFFYKLYLITEHVFYQKTCRMHGYSRWSSSMIAISSHPTSTSLTTP